MKSLTSAQEAVRQIGDGASIMIGGFMCCGQALNLIDALLDTKVKDLTIICNDAGLPGKGVGKLVSEGRVRRLIASHIGLNPVAGEKMHNGQMAVELVPQGTLAERIRSHGAGLGGVLTPTGIGTQVEAGKQKIVVNGKEYLLEEALHADYSFVFADTCDGFGNCFLPKSTKNFNLVMAMAASHTIVETTNVVPIGMLDPDHIHIPGVFVKTIVRT